MNLNQLYYFKKLAELQNYTKASDALFITQPSLSYSIKSLEDELNTPLFEKSGRNIVLTKYGTLFLEYVNRGIAEIERGTSLVVNSGSPACGHIDISYIYIVGHKYIPQLVTSFSKIEENKNITFSLTKNTGRKALELLREGKCDMAFTFFIENEDDLTFMPVIEEELVLIVPKNHHLAAKREIDLTEARDYPFIAYGPNSDMYDYMQEVFKRSGFEPFVKLSIDDDHAIFGYVEHGYGIAVVPKLSTLSSFDIVPIHITNPPIKLTVNLAYKKDRRLAPATKKFFDYVLENI